MEYKKALQLAQNKLYWQMKRGLIENYTQKEVVDTASQLMCLYDEFK